MNNIYNECVIYTNNFLSKKLQQKFEIQLENTIF